MLTCRLHHVSTAEVVREVQLLVYDEIHYLRDKERGVVWEESIVLAPKSCRFAFLSATIPNAKEFAEKYMQGFYSMVDDEPAGTTAAESKDHK